jgi:transcriptional/translational regulatory protein YebC/TACO1
LTIASIPKNLIEGAVARGQGKSTSGAQLESLSLEVLMPPDIALIIDAETDNKTRTLHDLRHVIKNAGGVVGSTAFYFTRRGRAVLQAKEGGPTLSDILDEAIEHEGMEDVEELPDGNFLAWTQPSAITAIVQALSKKFELEILDSEIVWAPNEDTKVAVDSSSLAETLDKLCSGLKEYPETKAIYANVRQGSIEDEEWDKVEGNLDV